MPLQAFIYKACRGIKKVWCVFKRFLGLMTSPSSCTISQPILSFRA